MRQTIYLMRHGQTLFNSQHRIQGWSDSPLTELGKKQAKYAGEYIKTLNIERAYSSTSERAIDTLELATNLPKQSFKELREWNYGVYEAEPDYLYPRDRDSEFFPQFGGESEKQVQERMNKKIIELITQDPVKNTLIVSHGGSIRSFAKYWKEYEANNNYKHYDNCCILKFYYEDGIFLFQNMYNHDFSSLN